MKKQVIKNVEEKVCVSFKELHRNGIISLKYGGHIKHHFDDSCDYYDLVQNDGNMLIGCDGEDWLIIEKTKEYIRMSSEDTENVLYLSPDEYGIAVFK